MLATGNGASLSISFYYFQQRTVKIRKCACIRSNRKKNWRRRWWWNGLKKWKKQTNGNNKKKLKEWMNEWATEIISNTITNWNNSSNVSYISLFHQALLTIVLLKSPCHTGWLWFGCENFFRNVSFLFPFRRAISVMAINDMTKWIDYYKAYKILLLKIHSAFDRYSKW